MNTILIGETDGLFTPAEYRILEAWFAGRSADLIDDILSLDLPGNKIPPVEGAVAAIVLERIQHRLPCWAGRNAAGELVFGRKHHLPKADRRVLLLPRLLFGINWASDAPGMDCPMDYHLTWVPIFDRFVVTASADDDSLFGYPDIALGHFVSDAVFDAGVVGAIVRSSWEQASEGGCWEEFIKQGLVDEATAMDWARDAWTLEYEAESDEDVAEGWFEYDYGGRYYRRVVAI